MYLSIPHIDVHYLPYERGVVEVIMTKSDNQGFFLGVIGEGNWFLYFLLTFLAIEKHVHCSINIVEVQTDCQPFQADILGKGSIKDKIRFCIKSKHVWFSCNNTIKSMVQ